MGMAPRPAWIQCIRDQLRQRGFGDKRVDDLEKKLRNRAAVYRTKGEPMPEARASADLMQEVSRRSREQARGAVIAMARAADYEDRLRLNVPNMRLLKNGLADVALSMVEPLDGVLRTDTGSLMPMRANYLQRIRREGPVVYSKFGKGFMARQLGAANERDVAREIIDGFGTTQNRDAEAIARAFHAMEDTSVDLFNAAGGVMEKLSNYLPQGVAAAKLSRDGEDEFVRRMMQPQMLDWDRMQHPDWSAILPGEREQYLRDVFQTIVQDGANKAEPGMARGASSGNQLDNHRQLVLKSGDAWLEFHEHYGDGTLFDVLDKHLESRANQIAMVHVFGRNGEVARQRIVAQTLKVAADLDRTGVLVRKTREKLDSAGGFNAVMDSLLDTRAPSEFSVPGKVTYIAQKWLQSSLLGSVALTAVPTDLAQRMERKLFTGQYFNDGFGRLLHNFISPTSGKLKKYELANMGIVLDDMAGGLSNAATRFSSFMNPAETISGKVSGIAWRLAGMNLYDNMTQRSVMWGLMSQFRRWRGSTLDQVPQEFQRMFHEAGIDSAAWDAIRANTAITKTKGRLFGTSEILAPISILDTNLPDRESLFNRLNSVMQQEASHQFIYKPSLSSQAFMHAGRAPDSWVGAGAASAVMFKGFTLSLAMTQGRLAFVQAGGSQLGRLAYMARFAVALGMAGALVIQAKHLFNGEDPEPMDTWSFWGRAMMYGGGLGFMGDAISSFFEHDVGPLAESVAGPLAGAVYHAGHTAVTAGQAALGAHSGSREVTWGDAEKQAADLSHYLVPGNSLSYLRAAYQREVVDQLARVLNPRAYELEQRRIANAQRNGYGMWWRPGQTAPDRMPNFGSIGGQ